MIEIGGGITIGAGITIGPVPAFVVVTDFITEDGVNKLISESGDQFIEEN
jgi:hypothetical protein